MQEDSKWLNDFIRKLMLEKEWNYGRSMGARNRQKETLSGSGFYMHDMERRKRKRIPLLVI